MLPPKKNQAAREEGVITEDTKDKHEEEEVAEEEPEYKNVFEETIVQGRRKHYVPKGKQIVEEWLCDNFEEKDGRKCPLTKVYSAYLQLCVERNLTDAITEPGLNVTIKSKFPRGFAVKDESYLKIKDVSKTPKSSSSGSGVSQKYKMKEVIHEAFQDLQDPSEGVMFNTLRKHIMGKVPALQLDLKPKLLLRGLEMGVYHGYVELIKGTGRAGKYRWFDPDRKEEKKPAKNKKKVTEEGKEGEKEGEASSADSAQEEEVEKKEGEEKEGEKKEGDEKEGEKDGETDEKKKKSAAKKKIKKTAKKQRKSKPIVHSHPTTIEETFPLAFTFMAEPKEARVHGIIKYIEKYYDVESQPEKIIKVLDSGAEKGYWHLVQGNNRSGIYQLAVDEFDPTDDDDLIGKIINAIMASVDPKTCSARALKEYLIEFHPDYKISERPNRFKKSLERSVNKGILRQLTGIGASGTFQLVEPFIPSPVILAGKDSTSDYEGESSDEEEYIIAKGPSGPQYDLTYFQDAYKPRPSKRRGMTRQVAKTGGFNKNAAYFDAQVKQERMKSANPQKRKATPSKPQRKIKTPAKKKARYVSSDEEEEGESSDEEDSTYGSDGEKYMPRPSSSRGGGSRTASAPPKGKKKPVKAAPVKASKSSKTLSKKGSGKNQKKSKTAAVKTENKGSRRSRRR